MAQSPSNEEIIEDIQRVGEKVGESPSANEYRDHGNHSLRTLDVRFGSFNEAKSAAGFATQPAGHSDDKIIKDIQRVVNKIGKPPSANEYAEHGEHGVKTLENHFGTFNEAIIAAGFEPNPPDRSDYTLNEPIHSDDELVHDIQRVARKVGKRPTVDDYIEHGNYSHSTLSRRFGSYNDAICEAGFQPQPAKHSIDDLILDIQRLASDTGEPPSFSDYIEEGEYSNYTLRLHFGTFNHAISAAGFQPRERKKATPVEDIVDDIQRVTDRLGRPPVCEEYSHLGDYSPKTLTRRIGGFNDALRLAGFNPRIPEEVDKKELLKDIRQVSDEIDDSKAVVIAYWQGSGKYGASTVERKFGGLWQACIRAGVQPAFCLPVDPITYQTFIDEAREAKPRKSLYGQLAAFTGIPSTILHKFSLDWVSHLESDRQETIISVPSEHLSTDSEWVLTVPSQWTIPTTGRKSEITINKLLSYFDSFEEPRLYNCTASISRVIAELVAGANIRTSVTRRRLRGTMVTHLAERNVKVWRISHQAGDENTGWDRSVEDYLLYLHQFRNIDHHEYTPSGIYLDPQSGDVKEV